MMGPELCRTETGVRIQISALEDAANGLRESVKLLTDRLGPVLRGGDAAVPLPQTAKNEIGETTSTFGTELCTHVEQLKQLRQDIESLTGALDW